MCMEVCIIPTTVSVNKTFQQACCQQALLARVISIIYEGPDNVSLFTTPILKVTCISSLPRSQKTRIHTIMLIDPNCAYFTSNLCCVNACLSDWPVTKEAVSGSK